jgi:molecular chaperone DnaK (HSP70)
VEELTPFLGIDLGTTNSVAASVDAEGRPMVLRNPAGAETVPSVVRFVSAEAVIVGDQARELAAVDPAHTVALVKRLMGTDRLFEFHGVEHTPESISALILRAIVDGVLPNRGGTPVPAVITVPAYFGIREREATQQAGLLAGLRVLELVSEPVAAALHYRPRGDGPVVVYDLGGGTFDVTVLRIRGTGSEVVAVDGDMDLGGADWDQRLRAHLLDRFVETVGPARDPAEDPAFMTELTLLAERAKKALTHTRTHEVALRHDGATARITVSQDEFAAMTRDLTDRTGDCVRRILATAGLAPGEVADCLLVGGSTRMPQVASALREWFGWNPRSHDPDLAVAKGAALRAWQLVDAEQAWVTPGWATDPVPARPSAPESTPAASVPFLSSVVPRSFGLLIHDSSDPRGQRRYVQHVIHQNAPLPADGHEIKVATILKDQATVRIEVYEQAGFVESAELDDNRRVLDGQLSGLPSGLEAGSPLIVALHLGLDGRLRVTAREPRSGVSLTLEAYVDGVLDANDRLQQAQRLTRLTVRQ